jgi:4-hydroxy-tetrahydrodipicolinate synthase
MNKLHQALSGVVATSITPFLENGEVDYPALKANAEYLVAGGADVIVPCGNTAEFFHLTVDEAKKVTRVVTETVAGRAPVITGIGFALPTALELGRYAQEIGVDAVMVHQPNQTHSSQDGVAKYIEAICDALSIGVIPYKRHSNVISDATLERVIQRPNLIAVKYAEPDVRAAQEIVSRTREQTHVIWVNGIAESWAPAFRLAGMPGFTSGLVNAAPQLSAQFRDAMRTEVTGGNAPETQRLWELLKPFEYLRAKYSSANNVPVVKEACAQLGLCGRTVRLPLTAVPPEDAKQISGILHDWGML